MAREIVLSVHPEFSEWILSGAKTVELRRRFPRLPLGSAAIHFYATSPVKAVVGSAVVSEVIVAPVPEIWERFSRAARVGRSGFDAYFAGTDQGVAIRLADPRRLHPALGLPELRERFGFAPPQSFSYASPELSRALRAQHEHAG